MMIKNVFDKYKIYIKIDYIFHDGKHFFCLVEIYMNLLIIYRPAWTPDMSAEQIDQQERVSFLDWRRKLAL